MTRVVVVIPALDEEAAIGGVVAAIPRPWVDEVIVVDNGSSDGTAAAAGRAGARVVPEPVRGYGRACLTGALAAGPDADLLVFLDGDGSDDPGELPALVGPILHDQADLVIGSRLRGGLSPGALPPQQVFGNRLASLLFRRLYGLPLTDIGPFRAIRGALFRRLALREMTYGWPVEMIARAAQAGGRVAEVPVRYRRRIGRSKVSGTLRGTLLAGYRFLAVILGCWLELRAAAPVAVRGLPR